MKFKFEIQQYQTDAVKATVNVFAGLPSKGNAQYRRDQGKRNGQITFEEEYIGFRNGDIELSSVLLLNNIQAQQLLGDIPQSKALSQLMDLGLVRLILRWRRVTPTYWK